MHCYLITYLRVKGEAIKLANQNQRNLKALQITFCFCFFILIILGFMETESKALEWGLYGLAMRSLVAHIAISIIETKRCGEELE